MAKTFLPLEASLSHPKATATRYCGKGVCWLCPFDHREPPYWECTTQLRDGKARMILCKKHGDSWAKETRAKVIDATP